jgi:glucose-6-phosphate isomerase
MNSMQRLTDADAVGRLRDHDASLFSDDPAVQRLVATRLGWTSLASAAPDRIADLEVLGELIDGTTTDVALLGMGGSSLAALVMGSLLAEDPARPRLHVLDTTCPADLSAALDSMSLSSTAWVVSSKSGSTIEPNTLYSIVRPRVDAVLGREAAGKRFVAVTDPGSSLARLAEDEGFLATFLAPPDVGGRYSALSPFGLVPAELIGIDLPRLIDKARYAEDSVSTLPPSGNPAAQLAAFMADGAAAQRDKLTLVMPPRLRTFGLWAEQLIAESLGKHGKGIVPVIELSEDANVAGYSNDRMIAVVRSHGDAEWARGLAAEVGMTPVHETILSDEYDIGAAFVTWEWATALAGFLLGINPFDEPDVSAAKEATARVLAGELGTGAEHVRVEGIGLAFIGRPVDTCGPEGLTAAMTSALSAAEFGEYLAILAYVPDSRDSLGVLENAVARVTRLRGVPICLELGPRYLHSTGQLHKGGPNSGVFVVLTTEDPADISVPDNDRWTLRDLYLAQSTGDAATLAARQRRVVSVVLPDASSESITRFADALIEAAVSLASR